MVVVKLRGQATAHAVVCGKLDGRARLARCRLVEILENSPNDGLVVAELNVQFQLKIRFNCAGGSALLHDAKLNVLNDVAKTNRYVFGLALGELVVGHAQVKLPHHSVVELEGGIASRAQIHTD